MTVRLKKWKISEEKLYMLPMLPRNEVGLVVVAIVVVASVDIRCRGCVSTRPRSSHVVINSPYEISFFRNEINNPLFKQKVLLNASMLSSQVCMSDGVEISYPFLDSRAENLDGRNLRRMKRSKNSPNQKTFLAS